MLLADHLKQQAGADVDIGGMIASLASRIDKAQRFVLGRDAAEACVELLRSRPSNLVKALPLCRLPYPTMWVETSGGFSENHRGPEAPVPSMQGTLIDGLDSQRGCMTVAWVHPPTEKHPVHHCNASPYGLWFDFSEDGDAGALVRAHHAKILEGLHPKIADLIRTVCHRIETRFNIPGNDDEAVRNFMRHREWWARWANDKREVEALHQHQRHMCVGLSPHGLGAVLAVLDLSVQMNDGNTFAEFMTNWEKDVEGEGPFGQFFITLLNSRNCTTTAPVSMAKLNKARAKRNGKKPPLLDYTTVNLTMSRARARAGEASGLSREAMRQHLVRGHFKVRASGVYWWNAFVRGDKPAGPRERYEVRA
jgi:hypothetical protein